MYYYHYDFGYGNVLLKFFIFLEKPLILILAFLILVVIIYKKRLNKHLSQNKTGNGLSFIEKKVKSLKKIITIWFSFGCILQLYNIFKVPLLLETLRTSKTVAPEFYQSIPVKDFFWVQVHNSILMFLFFLVTYIVLLLYFLQLKKSCENKA